MQGFTQKVLVGTSILLGMSAFSGASALAAGLSNIQFSDSNFRTYNGTTLGDITNGDPIEAIEALTDDDLYTNVELGIGEGTTTSFSGTLGGQAVTVSGVTMDDWMSGGLAEKWTAGFGAAYPMLAGMGDSFASLFMNRVGDPNVSSFTQGPDGKFTLTTVGYFNLLNAPWVATDPALSQAAVMASALLGGNPLQVSEVAKVIVDGAVEYVFGFSATETGVIAADAGANDSSSHTGLYSVTFGEGKENGADVPEPSILLGLVAAGGALTATKRKLKQA